MKSLFFLAAVLVTSLSISQNYQSAESVEWDPVNNQWLVANGDNILTDNAAGALGIFSNGSASHGMEVIGNTLFVIDSNVIRGFDLTTENEVMALSISGVSFLNGMASDGSGMLWVTDFSASQIHAVDVSDLDNPTSTVIVDNTGETPNGILYDTADRLLFVTWGGNAKVKAVDLNTNVVTDIADTGLANIDGIVRFDGGYIISSWSPARLTRYNADFTTSEIVDTPSLNSPADIGVNPDGIVGVPMGSNVVYVDVNVLVGFDDFQLNSSDFKLSENPVKETSVLTFNLWEPKNVSISLYSILGKKVRNLVANTAMLGAQIIKLNSEDLASGLYIMQIEVGTQKLSKKLLVE